MNFKGIGSSPGRGPVGPRWGCPHIPHDSLVEPGLRVLAPRAQAPSRPCVLPSLGSYPRANYSAGMCTPGLAKGPLFKGRRGSLGNLTHIREALRGGEWSLGIREKKGSGNTEDRSALHFNPHRNGRTQRESRTFTSFSLQHTTFRMHLVVMLILKHSCLPFVNKNSL